MPLPSNHHHVLLLGGHGKIAQLLTPLLLRRGWDVTSVIRAEEQVPTVRGLAPAADNDDGGPARGKLTVLVRSLEEVKSEVDAGRVLGEVGGVDFVVWSAGMFCFLFFFFFPLLGVCWVCWVYCVGGWFMGSGFWILDLS
jgi:NAD(P)-dependent dehydrogenase (short-subunit alcohol dehydrogenase family)